MRGSGLFGTCKACALTLRELGLVTLLSRAVCCSLPCCRGDASARRGEVGKKANIKKKKDKKRRYALLPPGIAAAPSLCVN